MASLNVLFSDPHNFLKEVTKKVRKVHKIFFVAQKKLLHIFPGPSIFA